MHELSIAQSLLKLCEDNAAKNNAKEVTKIKIKVGRLSGIEPHYLESAFSVCQAETICENAKLIINVQEIVVKCKECGNQSELSKNEFLCPKCNSQNLEVIDGEDMYLMKLEMI
ncbi:hydrogenase nickel insertion protein HypA [Campylobacter pinnipediorum subsp. pinnipediorum]|uniref:hydrogenase maturation nickel metallochaperone HypA n=1 Tax=Campylobacter pinnipediorum TaxID=1965231 RepID=UPI0009953047|nr:hydrogenase maturation nickel metallochaperone HypA [Campylobacter pinnipediorum]AQW81216.1 hydrogenase nickel insertion protein HypA [Campylobacter pinnipediorum subsp. pinnipediorum]